MVQDQIHETYVITYIELGYSVRVTNRVLTTTDFLGPVSPDVINWGLVYQSLISSV